MADDRVGNAVRPGVGAADGTVRRAMTRRWTIAACVALALATLDPTSWRGREAIAGEACDADAKPAPLDYTLQDMNDNAVHLEDFTGNVILLNFWATWCGPCKIEIPWFVELQEEYGDRGFIVLGLSVDDTVDQIKPFAAEYNVNYPMLVGLGEDEFREAWGPVWGLPMSYWIDRSGTWCKTHMGIGTKEEFEADLLSLL